MERRRGSRRRRCRVLRRRASEILANGTSQGAPTSEKSGPETSDVGEVRRSSVALHISASLRRRCRALGRRTSEILADGTSQGVPTSEMSGPETSDLGEVWRSSVALHISAILCRRCRVMGRCPSEKCGGHPSRCTSRQVYGLCCRSQMAPLRPLRAGTATGQAHTHCSWGRHKP